MPPILLSSVNMIRCHFDSSSTLSRAKRPWSHKQLERGSQSGRTPPQLLPWDYNCQRLSYRTSYTREAKHDYLNDQFVDLGISWIYFKQTDIFRCIGIRARWNMPQRLKSQKIITGHIYSNVNLNFKTKGRMPFSVLCICMRMKLEDIT